MTDKKSSAPDPALQRLKDPDIEPTPDNLQAEFDDLYPLYNTLINLLESDDLNLGYEWRYYKDGKSWLCKITRGKKTVVWMSAWVDCFRLGFYFTEKAGAGIADLEIDNSLKDFYATADAIGRLKPLVVDLKDAEQLPEVRVLLDYKISKL